MLHGGKARSSAPVTGRSLSWLRALTPARRLGETLHGERVGLWVLRYRTAGWNAHGAGKVEDARWALDQIRAEVGEVPSPCSATRWAAVPRATWPTTTPSTASWRWPRGCRRASR